MAIHKIKTALAGAFASTALAGGLWLSSQHNEQPEPQIQPEPQVLTQKAPKERKTFSVFFGEGGDDLTQEGKETIRLASTHLLATGDTYEIRGCSSQSSSSAEDFAQSYRDANTAEHALKATPLYGIYKTPFNTIKGDVAGMGAECPPLNGADKYDKTMRRAEIITNPPYLEN